MGVDPLGRRARKRRRKGSRHSEITTGQERAGGKGVDTLGWSPGKKGRKSGHKHSGMISRLEREEGKGVDTVGWSRGKKRKEEWA